MSWAGDGFTNHFCVSPDSVLFESSITPTVGYKEGDGDGELVYSATGVTSEVVSLDCDALSFEELTDGAEEDFPDGEGVETAPPPGSPSPPDSPKKRLRSSASPAFFRKGCPRISPEGEDTARDRGKSASLPLLCSRLVVSGSFPICISDPNEICISDLVAVRVTRIWRSVLDMTDDKLSKRRLSPSTFFINPISIAVIEEGSLMKECVMLNSNANQIIIIPFFDCSRSS